MLNSIRVSARDCATWGKSAEIAAQCLRKGSRMSGASRLHTGRWVDAQTGERRSRVEIVVDDLILLGRPTPVATAEDEPDARGPQLSPFGPTPAPRATRHDHRGGDLCHTDVILFA